MMLFMPVGLGVLIGVIVLLLTTWFKRKSLSKILINTPAILTTLSVIILFYVGLVAVRGFEGAAYGFLAGTMLIFAVISLIIGNINKAN